MVRDTVRYGLGERRKYVNALTRYRESGRKLHSLFVRVERVKWRKVRRLEERGDSRLVARAVTRAYLGVPFGARSRFRRARSAVPLIATQVPSIVQFIVRSARDDPR